MKHVILTEVDAVTKIPCTVEPQRTGPSLPAVKGWVYIWHDQSTWPVEVSSNGTYLRAPKYYGTCDDDANTSVAGVLQVLTTEEYQSLKTAEYQARKPFPSWIGNEETMAWDAPTPYPDNGKQYTWDEPTVSWIEVTQ
jgi:hypothetical protein